MEFLPRWRAVENIGDFPSLLAEDTLRADFPPSWKNTKNRFFNFALKVRFPWTSPLGQAKMSKKLTFFPLAGNIILAEFAPCSNNVKNIDNFQYSLLKLPCWQNCQKYWRFSISPGWRCVLGEILTSLKKGQKYSYFPTSPFRRYISRRILTISKKRQKYWHFWISPWRSILGGIPTSWKKCQK